MPPVTSTLFTEILRPKSLDQAILTKRVRDQLANELTSQYGLISNVLLFGGPGQGKCLGFDEEIEIFIDEKTYNLLKSKKFI